MIQSPLASVGRLLMTGFTDEQLRFIGEMAVVWNSNEKVFERLIWRIANWGSDEGALVTTDLGNVSKETLARNLAYLNLKSATCFDFVIATIDFHTELRIRRNNLLHSLPITQSSEAATKAEKRSAKKGQGTITTTNHDASVASLEELSRMLALGFLALTTADSQVYLSSNPRRIGRCR